MIQVYNPSNKDFNINGDMVIQPSIAELSVELNGIASIEMELPFDEFGRWEYVIKDSIIRCPTPWDKDKGQLFRVYETEKDMDRYKVYARHIIADLMKLTAKDLKNDDVLIVATGITDGQGAINKLLANTKFVGHSNITKTDNTRWERKLITEALLSDDENSFINRWGGELLYNNFDVYMNIKIGDNYGVKISYGKNLTGITENVNMDGVVTRIIPVGYDGLKLDGKTPWIDSPNINKYAEVHEQIVEFSDVKVKENLEDEEGFNTIEEARKELIRLSNLKFKDEQVDAPIINIKTTIEDISQTVEYKTLGYSGLEEINLGDTVMCEHYKIGIETEARCIGYKWNILTEKMIEIEIGDVSKNFFDKQADLSNAIEKILCQDGVRADKIAGIINSLQTKFRAQKSVAQSQDIRAMIFEDLDPKSPNYGAMCLGTMGFEIANKRTADGKDWDWRTFGTGKGFTADEIVAGVLRAITLESLDGSCRIDLNTGIINITKGIIQGLNSSWNLDTGEFMSNDPVWEGQNKLFINRGGIYSTKILEIQAEEVCAIYVPDVDGQIQGITLNPGMPIQIGGPQGVRILQGGIEILAGVGGGIKILGGDMVVNGKITCTSLDVTSSNKHRVIETSLGKVGINALETPEVRNEDVGRGQLDENCECVVDIALDFSECIETDEYDVNLTPYGRGNVWVEFESMNSDSFLVRGDTPNLRFNWRLTAIQKGCKGIRLKKIQD
jgi:phage minor structural protein